jgi:hypothetical protein
MLKYYDKRASVSSFYLPNVETEKKNTCIAYITYVFYDSVL